MAAKSTLKNMVLCLSLVCLLCSAVLACAYAVTKEPISEAELAKTRNSIAKVLPEFDSELVESSVDVGAVMYKYYKAPGAGYAVISNTNGFGGNLSLMVGITEDGIVYNTAVLSHSETPGLGAKCQTDNGFLSQFVSLDPKQTKLKVKKDGGDIDAITASTITSRAYTLAVDNALKAYNTIINMGGQENE